jgi:hypothetical protein
MWSYTSTPPHVFMVWRLITTGTTLPLPSGLVGNSGGCKHDSTGHIAFMEEAEILRVKYSHSGIKTGGHERCEQLTWHQSLDEYQKQGRPCWIVTRHMIWRNLPVNNATDDVIAAAPPRGSFATTLLKRHLRVVCGEPRPSDPGRTEHTRATLGRRSESSSTTGVGKLRSPKQNKYSRTGSGLISNTNVYLILISHA